MKNTYKDKNGKIHKIPEIDIKQFFINHHSTKKWFKPKPTTDEILNAHKSFDTVFHNNSAKNSDKSNNSDNVRLKTKKKLLNNGFTR